MYDSAQGDLHAHYEYTEGWSIGQGCYEKVNGYVYNAGNVSADAVQLNFNLVNTGTGTIRDSRSIFIGSCGKRRDPEPMRRSLTGNAHRITGLISCLETNYPDNEVSHVGKEPAFLSTLLGIFAVLVMVTALVVIAGCLSPAPENTLLQSHQRVLPMPVSVLLRLPILSG